MKRIKTNIIYPSGWLNEELNRDLNSMIGRLDEFIPSILVEDKIYGENRLSIKDKSKDVGAIAQDKDWEVQYLWWNSESIGNWIDGLVRIAYLTKNELYINKAKNIIMDILNTQDDDGYLGIYDHNLRYNFKSENGELWAQTTFLRAAFRFYEFTKDETIYIKIKKAIDHTIKNFNKNNSPFNIKKDYAGACHGLMFVDLCYLIYEHNQDRKYLEYATFLYLEYSKYSLSETDVQLENILDYSYFLKGHAVHTFEHLRALILANEHNGNLKVALNLYLQKIQFATTISGGPIGDEWIAKRFANSTNTGYEYCSIQELFHSYSLMFELTNDFIWADKMEWIFFNAGFAARNPIESQIAYCQTDNVYNMLGDINKTDAGENIRYKFSAVHQDVAVCCVPNAGRLLSYFTERIYYQEDSKVFITQFTSSNVDLTINNLKVKVIQSGNYPFELNSTIKVECEKPNKFDLNIRKPKWAKNVEVYINNQLYDIFETNVSINKEWFKDEIKIKFNTTLVMKTDYSNDCYFSYGPLIYGVDINFSAYQGKMYKSYLTNEEIFDTHYKRTEDLKDYFVTNETIKTFSEYKTGKSFQQPSAFKLDLMLNGKTESRIFKPMGSLILRKVTFKSLKENH